MDDVNSPDALRSAVARLGSFAAVAREAGVPKSTIQSRANAWGVQSPHPRARLSHAATTPRTQPNPPGTRTLDVTSPVGVSTEDLLVKHGIDPLRFDVTALHVQHAEAVGKGGEPLELQRVRVTLREKHPPAPAPFELPTPKPAGWSPRAIKRPKQLSKPSFIVVSADPHAPLHEPILCEHLAAYVGAHSERVTQLGFLGDASDNSPFGRHRPTPAFDFDTTTAWQAGYDHLVGIRSAAPHAKSWFTIGNHDHWPMQRAREQMRGMADARLPGDKYPLLDPRTYYRLEELGIECHGHPGAEYHDSEVEVLPGLTAMHGTKTGAIGGAVKEISGWEGTAIIQGHDHKLGMFLIVRRVQGGRFAEHWAISAGTLARKDLGYDPRKNCAQGWLVIVSHPNGSWSPMFARYDHDRQITTCGDWIIG